MAIVDGFNAEGKIRQRKTDNIFHHSSGMEFLETLEPRRPKKRRSFDFLIGNVEQGSRPWDF